MVIVWFNNEILKLVQRLSWNKENLHILLILKKPIYLFIINNGLGSSTVYKSKTKYNSY